MADEIKNVELTPDKIPTQAKASDIQLSPVEAAQVASGSGIGQGRFLNTSAMPNSVPLNKLPEGADPAGWMIVNNKYVNCDGKTPEELEKEDVNYHRAKADAATAQAANAINDNERLLRELEAAQATNLAAQAELEALKASQLPPANTTNGTEQAPKPPASNIK